MAKGIQLPAEVLENLAGWKKQYGKVHLLPVQEDIYIFCDVSFAQVESYNTLVEHNVEAAENALLSEVLLYPVNLVLEDLPAWTVQKLIQKILSITGMQDPEAFLHSLEQEREKAATMEGMAISFVAHAFNMALEDARALPLSKLTRYLAHAELVLGKKVETAKSSPRGPRGLSSRNREKLREKRNQQLQGVVGPTQGSPMNRPDSPPLPDNAPPVFMPNFSMDNTSLKQFGF